MTEPTTTRAGDEQVRTEVPSRAERVTFFEDRAEVVRLARARIPAGSSWVLMPGVALVVDDTTVVVRLRRGDGRVLGSRVARRVRRELGATAEQLAELEAEARAAHRTRADAEAALARVVSHERRLLALMEGVLEAVARVPRGDGKIGSWKPAYDEVDRTTAETLDEASEARLALERARQDEARVDAKLAVARSSEPRYEAAIEVQLELPAAQELELEATYRVPCALWRPEHMMRLVRRKDASGFDLHVKTWATVWQATGEHWEDVSCRFSTARPARMASPPLLTEDLVKSRKKTDVERRQVVVETREQAMEAARLDRGARAVEEMPGVDDGGEAQWFEAGAPASLRSDGHPMRLEIGAVTLPCEVDWVAYPEKTTAVHVRATATLTSAYPLLAGPVWVGRDNELAGRSKTRFIARGEPFEVGLGPDDGLRIRRTKEEKRDTAAVIGTQKLTREVQVHVTNLGASPRRLKVIERFPVSELEAVSVELLSAEGAGIDARDGMATFDLELAGNATTTVKLAYRVEAASNVVLPF